MTGSVFDASALLTILNDEPGTDAAVAALPEGRMSAVNLAEVVSKLADYGLSDDEIHEALGAFELDVVPFDEDMAYAVGALRRHTRQAGLSLGDRACLALAQQEGVPALTSDRVWAGLEIEVIVRLLRE